MSIRTYRIFSTKPRSWPFLIGRNFSTHAAVPLSGFSNERHTDVCKYYELLQQRLTQTRRRLPGPLSLAEKILFAHVDDPVKQELNESSYLKLRPVRVAMQDASAQMALLQFLSTNLTQSTVPVSIHCDHLIQASLGESKDLQKAVTDNQEIYEFLESASRRFGLGFWKPGSGIIHQVVLENYAFPGGLMIGTDSHTPNAGGLGMLAVGVGGLDAAEVMAGLPWELKAPKIIGVHLTGKLSGWTSPKDVILHLAGLLTVKGGTGCVLEYFGDGVKSLSATGMATICNMGAELGATSSIFPWTASMKAYLEATGRLKLASVAEKNCALLQADTDARYAKIVELNLSTLQPYVNGPFTPDLAHPLHNFADAVRQNNWPEELKAGLVGSCTNSSYQDMSRVSHLLKQAVAHGVRSKCQLTVTPGSEQIRATMERDGMVKLFEEVGAIVLANACGPCIGQWSRKDIHPGERNSIIASFNRNFASRNDGNPATHNFLSSPEVVVSMALAGRLTFNPLTDSLDSPAGPFRLTPPTGDELPANGFMRARPEVTQILPCEPDSTVEVKIDPKSARLQKLEPFQPWNGTDLLNMPILIKVQGKCTTDHISAAGPWLKYKGHLENISENTLMGAVNADTGLVNRTQNQLTGKEGTIAEIARQYEKQGVPWVVIADSNYGEGSAREHAAMQPRYLGGRVIIARSFARIHETNLKKQGMLPLTFADSKDYDRIRGSDRVSITGLDRLAAGSPLTAIVTTATGHSYEILLMHSFSADQISWFIRGSALNAAAALHVGQQ